MIGCSFAWKEFVMESMRDVDRVMEREIKKGSTPLQFEQLGLSSWWGGNKKIHKGRRGGS